MKQKKLLVKLVYFLVIIALICFYFFGFDQDENKFLHVRLVEEANERGIHFVHKNSINEVVLRRFHMDHIKPWFEGISSSVSVVDINNDGWMDIFFPSSQDGELSHLYINQNGIFFKEQAKSYGLDKLPQPSRALFFDCDGDGTKELFITTKLCPAIFKMIDGVYHPFSQIQVTSICGLSTGVNILDSDRDGDLDIIIGTNARFVTPNSLVNATNGGGTSLLINNGKCSFSEEKEKFKQDIKTHVHAVGILDIFGDGGQDLWIANDFNNDHVFIEDSGVYQKTGAHFLQTKSQTGMNAEVAYLGDSQRPYVFVSHVFKEGYFVSGNMLWKFNGKRMQNFAVQKNVQKCGWAWGAKFFDIDNDSHLDLIVSNGFISQNKYKNWWFKFQTESNLPSDIASLPKYWFKFSDYSLSGYERDCVFMNDGHQFYNISEIIHFDSEKLDGRGVAYGDFNNDGLVDVVVSNQKQKPQLYMNKTTASKNSWIGFSISSSFGDREAIGASVIVELESGRSLRLVKYPMNGYSSQSDSRLHFGLGQEKIRSVKVLWLDGLIEDVKKYDLNAYNVIHRGTL